MKEPVALFALLLCRLYKICNFEMTFSMTLVIK